MALEELKERQRMVLGERQFELVAGDGPLEHTREYLRVLGTRR